MSGKASFIPDFDLFRFGNDGTDAGHTFRDGENYNINVDVSGGNVVVLLRGRFQETGGADGSGSASLQFQRNGGGYGNITNATSFITGAPTSTLDAEDNGTADHRLTAGSGSFDSLANTIETDRGSGDLQIVPAVTANNHMEFVFGFTLVAADLADGDVLEFQMSASAATAVNTVTPTIRVIKSPGRIKFVDAETDVASSSGTSITLNRPAAVNAGDLMIAVIGIDTNASAINVPSGWTQYDDNGGSSDPYTVIIWREAGTSEAASWSVTWTGNSTAVLVCSVWYGHNGTNPFNQISWTRSTTTTPATGTLTADTTGNALIALFCQAQPANNAYDAPDAGWTEMFDTQSGDTGVRVNVDYRENVTATTGYSETKAVASSATHDIAILEIGEPGSGNITASVSDTAVAAADSVTAENPITATVSDGIVASADSVTAENPITATVSDLVAPAADAATANVTAQQRTATVSDSSVAAGDSVTAENPITAVVSDGIAPAADAVTADDPITATISDAAVPASDAATANVQIDATVSDAAVPASDAATANVQIDATVSDAAVPASDAVTADDPITAVVSDTIAPAADAATANVGSNITATVSDGIAPAADAVTADDPITATVSDAAVPAADAATANVQIDATVSDAAVPASDAATANVQIDATVSDAAVPASDSVTAENPITATVSDGIAPVADSAIADNLITAVVNDNVQPASDASTATVVTTGITAVVSDGIAPAADAVTADIPILAIVSDGIAPASDASTANIVAPEAPTPTSRTRSVTSRTQTVGVSGGRTIPIGSVSRTRKVG